MPRCSSSACRVERNQKQQQQQQPAKIEARNPHSETRARTWFIAPRYEREPNHWLIRFTATNGVHSHCSFVVLVFRNFLLFCRRSWYFAISQFRNFPFWPALSHHSGLDADLLDLGAPLADDHALLRLLRHNDRRVDHGLNHSLLELAQPHLARVRDLIGPARRKGTDIGRGYEGGGGGG